MSLNHSSIPPSPAMTFIPPPGTNFLATINTVIPFLMINATMGAVEFSMLLALLFFSTVASRRKPLFILNVTALVMGIATAAINLSCEEIHSLKYPLELISAAVIILIGTLNAITPLLADSILLLRLYAVFPPSRTPRAKFIVILGFPVVMKFARLINAIIYLRNFASIVHSVGHGGAAILVASPLPNVKVEWFLQMFDNIYASVLFLSTLYRKTSWNNPDQTVTNKIQALFWISVSNFVFPVILGIAQITIYMARPDKYIVALYVEEANFHFTIMGVIFATIWASEGRWADKNQLNNSAPTNQLSAIRFGSMPVSKTRSSQEGSGIYDGGDTDDVATYHSGHITVTSRSHSFGGPPAVTSEKKNEELVGSDQQIHLQV